VILFAKTVLILFGFFLIAVGILMLIKPIKSRALLRLFGSTNLINYGEITIRMIPAVAFVLYASYARFPTAFELIGWFMLVTSFILFLVPRKWHHAYAVKSADLLKPDYIRCLSPFSVMMGGGLLYAIL
jgi:hypothetical protein